MRTLLIALLLAGSPKPSLTLSAPNHVMGSLSAPTEVLVRVKITNPPECFGLAVFWGDGERSMWETCGDDVYRASHKDKVHGEMLIEAQLWAEGKQVAAPVTHVLNII